MADTEIFGIRFGLVLFACRLTVFHAAIIVVGEHAFHVALLRAVTVTAVVFAITLFDTLIMTHGIVGVFASHVTLRVAWIKVSVAVLVAVTVVVTLFALVFGSKCTWFETDTVAIFVFKTTFKAVLSAFYRIGIVSALFLTSIWTRLIINEAAFFFAQFWTVFALTSCLAIF